MFPAPRKTDRQWAFAAVLAVGFAAVALADAGSSPSWARTYAAISLTGPRGIAVDRWGNLYVSDTGAATVHKITPAAEIMLLPGGASIVDPVGLAADSHGNVLIADTRREDVYRVDADGRVTLAGTPTIAEPRFRRPTAVAIDRADNAFVADPGDATIRRISSDGTQSTFAGQHGSFGNNDGSASAARFLSPSAIAVDRSGTLYVTDDRSHTVRSISSGGFVSTLAGAVGQRGAADGVGSEARFNNPRGIAVDGYGNIYVADTGNSAIRKVSASGEVTTFAGKLGSPGDADGPAAAARFRSPESIAADDAGNVFVADTGNRCIRQISPEGIVTTIAGSKP